MSDLLSNTLSNATDPYGANPPAVREFADESPLAFRVVRGSVWVALSSYLTIGFGFVANLVLTRLLAAEHFGIFALGLSLFAILDLRTKIGIDHAFGQRKETTGELIGTHLALSLAASSLSLLLTGVASSLLLALGYSSDVVWVLLVLALVGVSQAIMGTAWVLLDKALRFGQASLVRSIVFPLSYIPAFWLALNGGGYWSLVAQNAAYTLLLLFGLWWAARRHLPSLWRVQWKFDRQVASQLLRFGVMAGLATLMTTLFTQFDSLLVGTMAGTLILGFYDRAYRIAQWPTLLVTGVITRTAFYAYARLQDDPVRLNKSVTMTVWLTLMLAVPLGLVGFVTAPDLVTFLYGERWLPSAIFVRFLVVYSTLRPLLDIAASLFIAVGKPHRATIVTAIEAGTLIGVATPLTIFYGAVGTAIGVGIAFIAGLVAIYWYLRRTIAFSVRDTLAAPGLAALLAVAIGMSLTSALDAAGISLILRLLLTASSTTVVFFAVLLLVQPARVMQRLSYVWQLVRGRRVLAGDGPV